MRNKKSLILLLTLCASAWGQDAGKETPAQPKPAPAQETPASTQETPAAGPAAKPEAANKPEAVEKAETPDPQAPKRFVPSQRTPADNSASFPVDI